MAVPNAVQQQIDQAEALQAQLYPEESQASDTSVQPVSEEVVPDPVSNVVELPRQVEPVRVAETPAPDAAEDAGYWRRRFETVQGKLNAEIPQLHQQVKEQNVQLQILTQQLAAKTEAAPVQDELATSKDDEVWGQDQTDMIRRVSAGAVREVISQEIAKLRQEFGAVQEQVGHVSEQVAMSASDKFWAGVMTLVPDWKQIDANPQWIEWLDTTPEFAEDTYRSLATKAIQKGDAQKIANLVKLFRGPQQEPVQQAQPAVNPELLRQVAPSTSRASSPAPQTGKIWSAAEYQAAMDVRNERRMGKAEADRLEAEANQAVAEGRVRWG